MTYIIGLVIIGLFFLALNYFTDLNRSQKINIAIILFAIILIASLFNFYNEKKSEHTLNIAMKFNQGETLKCDGLDVNSTFYDLSTGTYTFIGRENTKNAGRMISASICE